MNHAAVALAAFLFAVGCCHAVGPLGLLSTATVPDDVVAKISELEQESLSMIVARLKKDKNTTDDYAAQARLSFLRWASLRYFTKEPLVPNLQVDDFWHSFLLFTMPYQRWCDRHFGEFIHHFPSDEPDENGWKISTELMLTTYGEDWTGAADCGSSCGALDSSGCGNCHAPGAKNANCCNNADKGKAGCGGCHSSSK